MEYLVLDDLEVGATIDVLGRQVRGLRAAWVPLLGRGGCHNRWYSLADCDHRDSITRRTCSAPSPPATHWIYGRGGRSWDRNMLETQGNLSQFVS
jgi:hypothetical protein